jgi:hypothetical protein
MKTIARKRNTDIHYLVVSETELEYLVFARFKYKGYSKQLPLWWNKSVCVEIV